MCFCKPDDPCHADVLLEVANSLLEQDTPGDITAATQQDQGENHLAEGQQDDSTKADESDLLDHGLTLVSHGVPLDPSHYDTDAADHFLDALGFGRQDPVILSAGGKDFWRIPRKPKAGYDWEQVTAQAANGRDWPGFLRLLKDRPNACFQSCTKNSRCSISSTLRKRAKPEICCMR